jgi:hypothetical protein
MTRERRPGGGGGQQLSNAVMANSETPPAPEGKPTAARGTTLTTSRRPLTAPPGSRPCRRQRRRFATTPSPTPQPGSS